MRGKHIKEALVLLFYILLPGLVPRVQTANPTFGQKDTYVEVHGPNIAHVPITAKYVKYDGIVKRISRSAATLSAGEGDCQCPKCYNGHCYTIIYANIISPMGISCPSLSFGLNANHMASQNVDYLDYDCTSNAPGSGPLLIYL